MQITKQEIKQSLLGLSDKLNTILDTLDVLKDEHHEISVLMLSCDDIDATSPYMIVVIDRIFEILNKPDFNNKKEQKGANSNMNFWKVMKRWKN